MCRCGQVRGPVSPSTFPTFQLLPVLFFIFFSLPLVLPCFQHRLPLSRSHFGMFSRLSARFVQTLAVPRLLPVQLHKHMQMEKMGCRKEKRKKKRQKESRRRFPRYAETNSCGYLETYSLGRPQHKNAEIFRSVFDSKLEKQGAGLVPVSCVSARHITNTLCDIKHRRAQLCLKTGQRAFR